MKKARIVLALTAALSLVPPAAAMAKSPTKDAKESCKKGGWQQLVRSEDGTGFRNQGACVSYASHGGNPVPAGGGET